MKRILTLSTGFVACALALTGRMYATTGTAARADVLDYKPTGIRLPT